MYRLDHDDRDVARHNVHHIVHDNVHHIVHHCGAAAVELWPAAAFGQRLAAGGRFPELSRIRSRNVACSNTIYTEQKHIHAT